MTLLIPYRDRSQHLTAFLKHMATYLPEAKVVVIEQCDERPFNRGALLNCGYTETKPKYFALHDVDKLPISADYSEPVLAPRQLADNKFQTSSYFGGVTLFSGETFERIDGFRNDFWGWGGEDNEILFRLKWFRTAPEYRFGLFEDLPHPRPESEFNAYRWRQAQQQRPVGVGLRSLRYSIQDRIETDYLHLKVIL